MMPTETHNTKLRKNIENEKCFQVVFLSFSYVFLHMRTPACLIFSTTTPPFFLRTLADNLIHIML